MYSTEVRYYLQMALLVSTRANDILITLLIYRGVAHLQVNSLSHPISNPSANLAKQNPLTSYHLYPYPT